MQKKLRAFIAAFVLLAAVRAVAAPTDAELTRNIERQISGLDYGSRRPVVMVVSSVVTLSGTVNSLWLKEETINRALKVQGIAQLISELMISKAENDVAIAKAVSERIQRYDRLTPFDDIQGNVRNGTVRLSGATTDEQKLTDVIERVAKVRGVQAIDNKVAVLPASQSDDQLRVRIANAIYRDEAFVNYSMADPPIHIIVNNSHVTLVGIVRGEIEKRKALEAARFVPGVLAVDDRIQLARNVK